MEIHKCGLTRSCCHFLLLGFMLHRLSITGGCVLVSKSASTERQKRTIFLRISFHWTRTPELLSPTYNVYMDRQRITRSSRICTENLVLNRYKPKTSFSPQMQDKYWTEGVAISLLLWPKLLYIYIYYIYILRGEIVETMWFYQQSYLVNCFMLLIWCYTWSNHPFLSITMP
jgi:hypothetical protein